MKSYLPLVVVVIFVSLIDESYLDSCPSVNFMRSINVDKFLGVWYQFAISGDFFRYPTEKCVSMDLTLNRSNRNITVTVNRICSTGMISRRKQTIWRAKIPSPNRRNGRVPGKLDLSVILPDGERTVVDLHVINTDYTHSAVLYACRNIRKKAIAIWILTRKRKPSDTELAAILASADATLENNCLEEHEFRITDQENCGSVINTNVKNQGNFDIKAQDDLTSLPRQTSTTAKQNGDGIPNLEPSSRASRRQNNKNQNKLTEPLRKAKSLAPAQNEGTPWAEGSLIPYIGPLTDYGGFTEDGLDREGAISQTDRNSALPENEIDRFTTNNMLQRALHTYVPKEFQYNFWHI